MQNIAVIAINFLQRIVGTAVSRSGIHTRQYELRFIMNLDAFWLGLWSHSPSSLCCIRNRRLRTLSTSFHNRFQSTSILATIFFKLQGTSPLITLRFLYLYFLLNFLSFVVQNVLLIDWIADLLYESKMAVLFNSCYFTFESIHEIRGFVLFVHAAIFYFGFYCFIRELIIILARIPASSFLFTTIIFSLPVKLRTLLVILALLIIFYWNLVNMLRAHRLFYKWNLA